MNLLTRATVAFIAINSALGALCAEDVHAQVQTQGFTHESELGVVTTSGNTQSSSFSLKQANAYRFTDNQLILSGRYLLTEATVDDVSRLSARNWAAALRYERTVAPTISVFAAEEVQSDLFAGLESRLNTDFGGKAILKRGDKLGWELEGGYRYTIENRLGNRRQNSNYLRAFSALTYAVNPSVSGKLSAEYLPNLTHTHDWQLNAEAAIAALLNATFSIKTGYLLRFDHELNPGAQARLDTTLTTALVAKF